MPVQQQQQRRESFRIRIHHLALNRYPPKDCVICLTISNMGIPLQHGEADGVYAQAG